MVQICSLLLLSIFVPFGAFHVWKLSIPLPGEPVRYWHIARKIASVWFGISSVAALAVLLSKFLPRLNLVLFSGLCWWRFNPPTVCSDKPTPLYRW